MNVVGFMDTDQNDDFFLILDTLKFWIGKTFCCDTQHTYLVDYVHAEICIYTNREEESIANIYDQILSFEYLVIFVSNVCQNNLFW